MGKRAANTFAKGMNKDSSVLNQPEGTYRNAVNSTLLNNNGEYYAISNEQGSELEFNIPLGFNVIGSTVVDDEVILCLVDDINNYSQIGVYKQGVYTQKVPVVGNDNSLGFDINYPIDIVGKKLFNGNTIVYFTDDNQPFASIDLDNPPTDIAKGKNIVPDINLPTIEYNSVVTGGKITGGVYQFVVRYLNNELVPTVATLPTNPIPITGSPEGSSLEDTQGAAYNEQVNKAIKLDITGIDTDYPYLELIVIGYEGAVSTPYAYITDTYNITSSTKSIIYSGIDEDSVQITTEEVLAEPITYSNARCVEQKDNRLFLSNLTESKSRYAAELQAVANGITVKYATEIKFQNYYLSSLNSADNKTYRRGEVYSFGLGVIFKDGSKSYTYHIPAPFTGVTGKTPANTGTKVLGTYTSVDEYPLDGAYPVGNIRHHVMPTEQQLPIYASGSTTNFNQLYVDFENINIPQNIKDNIQEIVIYRESRSSIEKRSKLAKGFVTNIFMGASDYEGDESDPGNKDKDNSSDSANYTSNTVRRGDATPSSFHFRKNFGFFNMQLNSYYNMNQYAGNVINNFKTYLEPNASQRSTHNGCYYSVKTLDEAIYDKRSLNSPSTPLSIDDQFKYQALYLPVQTKTLCFMSPETLLSDGVFLDAETLKGANFKRLAEYSTNIGIGFTDSVFENKTMAYTGVYNKRISFPAYVGNFNIQYEINSAIRYYDIDNELEEAQYINNGERVNLPALPQHEFDNDWSGKFLYVKTRELHDQNLDSTGNVVSLGFPLSTLTNAREPFTFYGDVGPAGSGIRTPLDLNNNLDMYEIENNISNQYGNIESSQYTPIYKTKDINITSVIKALGGDTFITRYTLNHKTLIDRSFPFYRESNYFIGVFPIVNVGYKFFSESWKDSESNRAFVNTSIHKNIYTPEIIPGNVFNSAVTYLTESDINCYYRYIGDDGMPYFPKSSLDDVWNALPNQEENRNYNTQYSKDNTINTNLVSRPLFDAAVVSYPNRTIYSEKNNEDSKVDEYQIFKQNNFYDLPEDTGEIVDTFVWNNDLYSHTPKALWRNYVNTVTREANSIGEVVLGVGGLFNLPAQKILTSDGGYGGTTTRLGNCVTPLGYFFVDSLQRKVFKLGKGLEDISLQGMHQYFDNNLKSGIDNTFLYDSPSGISMGWDNEYNRLILTQHAGVDSFTVSYSPVTKAWVSFHSYLPSTYITYDRSLYIIRNSYINGGLFHTLNVGAYGSYFGDAIEDTEVTFVSNDSAGIEKVFDNFNVHSRSYDNSSFENLDFYNTIQCVNDYQDSGELLLNTTNAFNPAVANDEVLVRWKKSHFQIAIPRTNQEANLDTAEGWKQASRLKSKYLKTTLKYNNLLNREFIVNFIEYLYRVIAR